MSTRSSRPSSPRAPLLATLCVAVLGLSAACAPGPGGGVTVSGAWVRPASVGASTAAYLTITNGSGRADTLLSVSSPGAGSVEMHETSMDSGGMTGMHPVSRIDIAAGATVILEPGSMHLMVMGLAGDLTVGMGLQLDLVFEHAGKVVVNAEVRQG